jgi:hypothetical protein
MFMRVTARKLQAGLRIGDGPMRVWSRSKTYPALLFLPSEMPTSISFFVPKTSTFLPYSFH